MIAMVSFAETIVAAAEVVARVPDVLRPPGFTVIAESVVTILRGNRQWRDGQRRKKQSSESKSF
jgi:hypothetical protein